jgi:hypothetical protein
MAKNDKQQGPAANGAAGESPLKQLATVVPGDVVEVWMEDSFLVKTVFLCQEEVDGRTFEWKWIFLDDGSLVEVSPDGFFRYKDHQIIKQGTSEYEAIVAQDGALVRFEERVRAGDSGRRPVHLTLAAGDKTGDAAKDYTITSTGTVKVRRLGDEPVLEPWQALSDDPQQNVYFGMIESADEANVALGLWTTHVSLSLGKVLDDTNISGVYRK